MYTKRQLEWRICSIVCVLGFLGQVRVDGADVPMTILSSAVAKGAGINYFHVKIKKLLAAFNNGVLFNGFNRFNCCLIVL